MLVGGTWCVNSSLPGWEQLGWKGVSVLRLVTIDTLSWGEPGGERLGGTRQGTGIVLSTGRCPTERSPEWSCDRLSYFPTTKFSLELGFEPKYNPEQGSFSSLLFFLIRVVYISMSPPQESLRQGETPGAHQPPFFLRCTTSLEKLLLPNVLGAQPFGKVPLRLRQSRANSHRAFVCLPVITKEVWVFFFYLSGFFPGCCLPPPCICHSFCDLEV